MPEALGVIDAPSNIETSTPSPAPKLGGKPSSPQKSSLGGGAQILKGLHELTSKHADKPAADKSAIPSEKAIPEKVEKKVDGAPEKSEAEKAAEAAKLQSTEGDKSKGTDGMTAEERAAFVAEKKSFEGWKSEKEKVTGELTSLKQQLEELKADKEAKEQRLKEIEPVALLQDIKLHPKYKDTIEKPQQEIEAFLGKVCKKYELKPSEVQSAIWSEDPFEGNEIIAEMQSKMDSVTSANFSRAVEDIRKIAESEAKLMKDPQGAWTALNAEKKAADAEAAAKAEKTYHLAKEAVWEQLPELFPFLKDVLKDADVAKEIKDESDKVNWSDMSPDTKAFYAQAGTTFLRFPSILKAHKDEIAQLKKALETATKQTSPANGTPHKEGDGEAKGSMKPSDFLRAKGLFFK